MEFDDVNIFLKRNHLDLNYSSWMQDSDLEWTCKLYNGSWKIGSTAGGSTGSKYWNNPKYYVNLKDVDDNDFENKTTVVVSLMQKDGPKKPGKYYIQFRLYKVIKIEILNLKYPKRFLFLLRFQIIWKSQTEKT